jgi:tRNA(fMet)-specific endonuclease VapC
MADGLVVVDTDLLIDFLRDRGPGAELVQDRLEAGLLRFTAVTAFELRLGADFLSRRGAIELLLAHRTLPLDMIGALHAAEVFLDLRQSGSGIELRDAMIAGICLRFGLPLATRNVRHLERVPGLQLVPISHP